MNGWIMTGIEVQDVGQNPRQNGEQLATSVIQPPVYSGCDLGKMLTDGATGAYKKELIQKSKCEQTSASVPFARLAG